MRIDVVLIRNTGIQESVMGRSQDKRSVVGMFVMMLAIIASTSACTDAPMSEPESAAFRCRAPLAEGGCESMPADCPVTLPVPHSDQPHCPIGAVLIPAAQDDCAKKLICVD